MQRIEARIEDSTPNEARPALDLYLPADLAARRGWKHGQQVELVLDHGAPWVGTVGMKPRNAPYLHRPVMRPGERMSMRDWLLMQDIADGAVVELVEERENRFRWERVLERGEWLPGRGPGERKGKPPVRQPRKTSPQPALDARSRPPTSFPLTDTSAVRALADEYWTMISAAERQAERRFEEQMEPLRQQGYLDRESFLALARWKSPRPKRLYERNTEAQIRSATARAFQASSDADAVAALRRLQGVGLRTATALLHWMRPDRFPVLDFRVVDALGEARPANWEDPDYYRRIAGRCRELAKNLGVDLRTLDRALWSWDKKRSKQGQ